MAAEPLMENGLREVKRKRTKPRPKASPVGARWQVLRL